MPAEGGERTEQATPRRRNEARAKGQVARSQDLASVCALLALVALLAWRGPVLWHSMLAMIRASLRFDDSLGIHDLFGFGILLAAESGKQLAPLMAILVAVVALVLMLQIGPLLTIQPLVPSLGKMNPIAGFQRLLSPRSAMNAAASVGKLLIVGAIAYVVLRGSVNTILHSFTLELQQLFLVGVQLTFRLAMWILLALLVLAIFDYGWQRYRYEKDLRMTKEEVRDELRAMEGDPGIKRRRRQIQLQLAMKRLRKEVPQADVVVTNPTHVAVAIRYDAETMPAPKVVAKGADYLALRIRQIAIEHGIPIVERRPLARALYENVEVGQCIPERFYHAIAEILSYVYELTGRSPIGIGSVARPVSV